MKKEKSFCPKAIPCTNTAQITNHDFVHFSFAFFAEGLVLRAPHLLRQAAALRFEPFGAELRGGAAGSQ